MLAPSIRKNEMPALRDIDVRDPLEKWLVAQHAEGGDTNIIHELKVQRPSARVDIAVVNGRLTAFEIKSDVDSLDRLPAQTAAFNAVFDQISLVTTAKHLALARKKIPSWWGILTTDGVGIHVRRSAKQNPTRQINSLLWMLTVAELTFVLAELDPTAPSRLCKKDELVALIGKTGSQKRIRDAVRSVLKGRRGRRF